MMIRHWQRGFSLVELSIVLVIIGTLAGSLVVPLSTSVRQARFKQTHVQLQLIRDAMHGYLASFGSLPCPVNESVGGDEDASVACDSTFGYVPATALGVMGERASNGALLDSWGRPIHYAISAVSEDILNADLQLCRTASINACPQRDLIANQIVWVVYSLGEQGGSEGIQIENQDNDNVFAVSGYSILAENPFDDMVVWASRSELVYLLLKANWLP